MLAEAFDGVLGGCVVDTNGENCVDDAQGKVVVAVLLCLGEVGDGEFGFAKV
jgi:hypothetical protein